MTAVAYSDKFTSSREQSATALGEKWEALVCWPHALRDSSEQQSSCGCCGRRAHLFDEAGVVCGQHLNAILGSGGKKKGGCRRRATCRRRHPSPETVWRALAEFDGEQQSEGGERPSFAPSMSTTTTTTALDHRTKSGVGGAGPRSTATSVAAHEGEVDASGSGGSSISSSFARCLRALVNRNCNFLGLLHLTLNILSSGHLGSCTFGQRRNFLSYLCSSLYL